MGAYELSAVVLRDFTVWFRYGLVAQQVAVVGRRGRPHAGLRRRIVEVEMIVSAVEAWDARVVVVDTISEFVDDGIVGVGEGVRFGTGDVVVAHGRVVSTVHEVPMLEGYLAVHR